MNKKILKGKLFLLSLMGILSLQGCAKTPGNGIYAVKDSHSCVRFYGITEFDGLFNLKLNKNVNIKDKNLKYDVLIDTTDHSYDDIRDYCNELYKNGIEHTRPNLSNNIKLGTVIDEKTIVRGKGLNLNSMTFATFKENSRYQHILLPSFLRDIVIYKGVERNTIENSVIYYATEAEITVKKILTIDDNLYYSYNSKLVFNDKITEYTSYIKPGDYIEVEELYTQALDSVYLLYRNQTGLGSNEKAIVDKNYNAGKSPLVKVEDTLFADLDGIYDKDYLLEALDTYSDADSYYSSTNEGIDFSKFRRK